MFSNVIRFLGGDPNKREIEKQELIVEEINRLEITFETLSDDALRAKTAEFRQRLAEGTELTDLIAEAYAAVREASKRTIGLRHYDVQLIGGITLHQGKIAEMRTGEGKTLVATLPVYLNALTGRGVHLVTVNDYLARRDARWMAPIYHLLGLRVGVLQMAAHTDGGRSGYLVDLERRSPHEDQDQLRMAHRHECYQADVTYGTNSEFGFDYLRDNLTMLLEDRVQRGHYYAIIDEVDNILIDEARTPLIISGPAQDEGEWYVRMAQVVRQLRPEDYEINEKDRNVTLTETGEAHVEELLETPLRDPDRPEDINPEQARLLGYLEQALRAQFLFRKNKDYLVQGSKVIIVDEFTGRLMPGRRWSEGLHQAVEAKEGVKVEPENITYATITLQNYFRMYEKLAGMTGTALTEAEEFSKIYKLDVLPIPTNLEYIALQPDTPLVVVEDRDQHGYRYAYYARREDTHKSPVFWKRKDFLDVVYRTHEAKLRAITQEILQYHVLGRPQLVGTTSVEHSELLSTRLDAEPIRRLAQVLLIRQAWLTQHNTDIISGSQPELQPLNRPLSELSAGELRPIARNLSLSLNPEDAQNLENLLAIVDLEQQDKPRLLKALQGGIPHQVLNARKHDEESIIIARAGAFGAVTIATNMAGRGVDIKLGGELPEEILRDTNRVLGRAEKDPFDLTHEQRRQALLALPPADFGIYKDSVKAFLQYMDDMERVRALGGLHVIGSERHEARRIDNQLRGRAARQGDPGSSRFYLSLEDELMRLFGGAQVENLWKHIMVDDSQPLEMNLLGRLVEQSQQRVEGANFDVRKHLLEYDDVLNTQRKRIYAQRDRVFEKEDLSEDVLEILYVEMKQRIPEALKDLEGPWRLLAFLEEVQPTFNFEDISHPSFTFDLLIGAIHSQLAGDRPEKNEVRNVLLQLAQRALIAEKDHLLRSAADLLQRTEEALERQRQERIEMLDTYFDGLSSYDEGMTLPRPQEMLTELSELTHIQLKLDSNNLRRLPEADPHVLDNLRQQIDQFLTGIAVNRTVGALERRLEESLELKGGDLQNQDWYTLSTAILDAVEGVFEQRAARLLGENGQIRRDLDPHLDKISGEPVTRRQWVDLLQLMAQGSRIAFDTRTHRRSTRFYTRLNYVFLAAQMLADAAPEEVTASVSAHLEEGLHQLELARGRMEWNHLVQNEARLNQLDERRRNHLVEALGLERFEELAHTPLSEFNEKDGELVCQMLGKVFQNAVYRDLLLRVISEQWVEYLTKVEALRVSIGLEAYGQRDPLVQYKGRASEMFQSLLADIRMGVISRLFTYRPRRDSAVAVSGREPVEAKKSPSPQQVNPEAKQEQGRKKRRRRR